MILTCHVLYLRQDHLPFSAWLNHRCYIISIAFIFALLAQIPFLLAERLITLVAHWARYEAVGWLFSEYFISRSPAVAH